MASTVAKSMLITLKKPLIPHAQARENSSFPFKKFKAQGKGIPMKNPKGAIIIKTRTTLDPREKDMKNKIILSMNIR